MAFGVFLDYFLITFAAIIVIVNPVSTAFIFTSLLPNASKTKAKMIAKRATLTGTTIFFAFALLGSVIFQVFGITLAAFRIAGGLILFGIAMKMIKEHEGEHDEQKTVEDKDEFTDNISIVPLAIPFISGPGSIATVMILTTQAPSLAHTIIVFIAVAVTTMLCYFAMIYSKNIVQYLGQTGKRVITKIFGLILAVISVQFVINGILDVMPDIISMMG